MGDRLPRIGDERFRLVPEDEGFRIERLIRSEGGVEHYYDEAALDYVDVPGHWQPVGVEGHFESREAARAYMIARHA